MSGWAQVVACRRLRSNCVQRQPQILAQVLGMLDPHGQPDQRVADPQSGTLRGGYGRVRHQGRMLDQALDAAEAFSQRENLAMLEETARAREIGVKVDRDDAAKAAVHLAPRKRMLGMRF